MTGRVRTGIAALLGLFIALVLVQLLVAERLQEAQQAHSERLAEARAANKAVMQHMTDAETGVRGFQLTGDRKFLEPFNTGRVDAFVAFDQVGGLTGDDQVRARLDAQRQAASHWLYAYAIPVVNTGEVSWNAERAARSKAAFDRLRVANDAVDAALRDENQSVATQDRRDVRTVQLVFSGLAILFLLVAVLFAAIHHRNLLAPLEDIRRTLQRLASGDRAARAVPAGTPELHAVIGTLNLLAAETERLLAEEHARGVRHELRQQVAAELRAKRDGRETAERVADLIGAAFGASVVHGRIVIEAGRTVDVRRPAEAPDLADRTVRSILSGEPQPGGLAVPLPGDAECPPGLIYIERPHQPEFSEDEQRLLGALAWEVQYAVRQQRLHLRQDRLIDELRALDERKDAFVATVTHELRTPLTSILGYTEVLSEDEDSLDPAQRRSVDAILRNAVRLRDTIADLLLLDPRAQHPEAGAAPVDLADLVRSVVAELTPAVRAKQLDLTVEAAPAWVAGDSAALERVIRNLLDNAVKFTPAEGRITCRAGLDATQVTVEITDTGIGIPADDLPGLFSPFHRGGNAMDRAVQGSGLGLAIVQHIVNEHGGTATAKSVLDAGSTFTVTLPALAAQQIPEALLTS